MTARRCRVCAEATQSPLVRLTPREAYALLMFFRSPAVVALQEAQHAARMTASEIAFQNDPETIAELAAQKQQAA